MTLAGGFAWLGSALFLASLLLFLYTYFIGFAEPAPAGPRVGPTITNLLLFSAFALHHSLLARARLREAVRRLVTPRLERAVYTWTASLLFAAVCISWRPVPGVAYTLNGVWWWIGVAAQGAGFLLVFRGSSAIDVLDLAGVRQVSTAADPQHVALETGGVYSLVRHPIYLGWTLIVFGAPVMTMTRLTFAVISTAYVAIAVPWEERTLLQTFGADYEAYRRRVRWRMLPGVY